MTEDSGEEEQKDNREKKSKCLEEIGSELETTHLPTNSLSLSLSQLESNYLLSIQLRKNDNFGGDGKYPLTNSEDFIKLLSAILEIIKGKDVIKATILLFLLTHKIIWGGAMTKLFPHLTSTQIIVRCQTLGRKGFCFEIKDEEEIFKTERKKMERIVRHLANSGNFHVDRMRFFGIGDQGREFIRFFKKPLEALLTDDDLRRKIKDHRLTFLYHTHAQYEGLERRKEKEEQKEQMKRNQEAERVRKEQKLSNQRETILNIHRPFKEKILSYPRETFRYPELKRKAIEELQEMGCKTTPQTFPLAWRYLSKEKS